MFTVRAQPGQAIVRLDDEKRSENPLVRRVEADGSHHVVVVTAPGYVPVTRRVTFDKEQDLLVELQPEVDVPSKLTPTVGKSGPAVSPVRQPGTPQPKGTTGTVRPLDKRNPFEEKK